MITPEALTKRLADIMDIRNQIDAILFNRNPCVKFQKSDELDRLQNSLHHKFNDLSLLCSEGETYFFL
jgi:hypothetical protein